MVGAIAVLLARGMGTLGTRISPHLLDVALLSPTPELKCSGEIAHHIQQDQLARDIPGELDDDPSEESSNRAPQNRRIYEIAFSGT